MNLPPSPDKHSIPDDAKGNPVYEQTRQDMPLWCCGRNCGRNSRIVVLVLGVVGIACSIFVCMSPDYFSYVSLRNDTFYDEDKRQPEPFEYATEANVGIFRYEILSVYEYPWPPPEQRRLFDALHRKELKRLFGVASATNGDEGIDSAMNPFGISRFLQDEGGNEIEPPDVVDDSTAEPILDEDSNLNMTDGVNGTDPDSGVMDDPFGSGNETDVGLGNETDVGLGNETDVGLGNETDDAFSNERDDILGNETDSEVVDNNETDSQVPVADPTRAPVLPPSEIPDVLPGSTSGSDLPTASPSSPPSMTNPNDLIDVEIGVVKPYPEGVGQFDSVFTNGQRGAMMAPIFAAIGLFFSLIELCCCTYKCSWLPTAVFLYLAFMFQLMTIFLFMSEDFCKYAQDCVLGIAGIMSVIAVVCYMIAQSLVCCTPRPPPIFNCCKKPPVRRKKKKKSRDPNDDAEARGLTNDDDDEFRDEDPDGYVDPYDDQSSYMPESMNDDDDDYGYTNADNNDTVYGEDYDDDTDTRGADTHGESLYTDGNDTYESNMKDNRNNAEDDYSDGGDDDESGWSTGESDSRRGID